MRRISVAGTSGSGKTTVGRALAQGLALPFVELDALHHGPNWQEASPEELRRLVEEAMAPAPDGWVIDGNYHAKLGDLVLERADTLVWLDLPLRVCLARLLRRTFGRLVRRTELWHGNRESLRSAFVGRESLFAWTVRSHFRRRRELPARIARHPQVRVVRLSSPREVERFLAEAGATALSGSGP